MRNQSNLQVVFWGIFWVRGVGVFFLEILVAKNQQSMQNYLLTFYTSTHPAPSSHHFSLIREFEICSSDTQVFQIIILIGLFALFLLSFILISAQMFCPQSVRISRFDPQTPFIAYLPTNAQCSPYSLFMTHAFKQRFKTDISNDH